MKNIKDIRSNINNRNQIKNISHIPVLLNEVKSYLEIKEGHTYIDGTFGAGGHSEMILSSANCRVVAIDRDPKVKKFTQSIKNKFSKNFNFLIGRLGEIEKVLLSKGIKKVNGGILFDLGVSSMQLENSKRGFSFMLEGPLDMRMGLERESASDIIKNYSEEDLAKIIYYYGEEKQAKRIAKAIVKKREEVPLETTLQLANLVRSVVGYQRNKRIDPATKTFQALRIKVNNELEEITKALHAAEKLLIPGARLLVISFHSLEDKIVKSFLREKSGKVANPSRHEIMNQENKKLQRSSFKLINRKIIKAGEREIYSNPRSRSAKLRVAERIENNLEYAV